MCIPQFVLSFKKKSYITIQIRQSKMEVQMLNNQEDKFTIRSQSIEQGY